MRIAKTLQYNDKLLILNMDWMPVLANAANALAQVKRLGASHYINMGEPVTAIGFTNTLNKTKAWSLAYLYALANPDGTCASILCLDENNWHILASHQGVALVHADRSYPNEFLANQALAQLKLTYPDVRIIQIINNNEFLQQVTALAKDDFVIRKIPFKAYKICLLVFIIVSIAAFVWLLPKKNESVIKEPNADLIWQQHIKDVLQNHALHGRLGTQELLRAIKQQPVLLAGWLLNNLNCVAQNKNDRWLCVSEYRRLDLKANNRSIIDAAPKSWQLEFQSLDIARASWLLKISNQAISLGELPKSKFIARNWTSKLQTILPLFTNLQLGKSTPVKIQAPTDSKGQILPAPNNLPTIASRKISLLGPLRSSILLPQLADAVAWQKLQLNYKPGVKPSMSASGLSLQLEGAIYEQGS